VVDVNNWGYHWRSMFWDDFGVNDDWNSDWDGNRYCDWDGDWDSMDDCWFTMIFGQLNGSYLNHLPQFSFGNIHSLNVFLLLLFHSSVHFELLFDLAIDHGNSIVFH